MIEKEKMQLIYQEVANIVNNVAFKYGINTYYEPFCNLLQISRLININEVYCSDINEVNISLLKAFISNDILKFKSIIANIINNCNNSVINDDSKYNYKQMLELLSSIYSSSINTELELKTIEDVIRYNLKLHTEQFNKLGTLDVSTLKYIKIEKNDYCDLEIERGSIVLSFAPYNKRNILNETFDFGKYYKWLEDISQDNIVFILAKEMPINRFIELRDFKEIDKKDELRIYTVSNEKAIDLIDMLQCNNDIDI